MNRRDDFNTSCPHCGSEDTTPWGKRLLWRYKCRDCGAHFHVEPNHCQLCSREIADEAEYCEWHQQHGFDDGKDELFVPEGVCAICEERRTYKFFEFCKECLEKKNPNWRDGYANMSWDDEDHEELITDL